MENDHETVAHSRTTYFRWLGRPYYRALQTAAASHGSSQQAIQIAQAMTDLPRRDLRIGRVRVHFFLIAFSYRFACCWAEARRAQATTGQRDVESAVRRALEIATHDYELNAAARRALEQSRREEREGKVRRFTTARDAVAHLKRL